MPPANCESSKKTTKRAAYEIQARKYGVTMSCYMCNSKATSVEHVPPRCLFPEKKDLPQNIDLRKELITVPACDVHNSQKSKDDEYLLYLLVFGITANNVGKNHFLMKVMRSIVRSSGLVKKFTNVVVPVTVVDNQNGQSQKTVAMYIDTQRLYSSLDHIARGLYFHHYKEQWLGDLKTVPEFMLTSLDPEDPRNQNATLEEISKGADELFAPCAFLGENSEVFKYQVCELNSERYMRLYFYEGCKVFVFFGSEK